MKALARKPLTGVKTGADPASVAPGVLLAATVSQHVATFCTTSPEVLSSLGLGAGG